MIRAEIAREQALKNGRQEAIDYCKKWTEHSIKEAINRGLDKTCLAHITYRDKEGKYYDCERDIKNWLFSLGYKIEPTGYSGGIWQDTQDICW